MTTVAGAFGVGRRAERGSGERGASLLDTEAAVPGVSDGEREELRLLGVVRRADGAGKAMAELKFKISEGKDRNEIQD